MPAASCACRRSDRFMGNSSRSLSLSVASQFVHAAPSGDQAPPRHEFHRSQTDIQSRRDPSCGQCRCPAERARLTPVRRGASGCVHPARSNGCRRLLGDVMAVPGCPSATPAHVARRPLPRPGTARLLRPPWQQAQRLARPRQLAEIAFEPRDPLLLALRPRLACDSGNHAPAC